MSKGFSRRVAVLACLALVPFGPAPATAAALPTVVGACGQTVIKEIGHRLEHPDSGSVVQYANGLIQISYDVIAEIHRSRVGDKVKVCLVSIPENCPPNDDRGKVYRATNLAHGGKLASAGFQA